MGYETLKDTVDIIDLWKKLAKIILITMNVL